MMFSFPPILDGNAGVKLSNNADSGFPKPIIGETFYSIKDGNWSDITVWQTASGRVGLLPTINDNVYVRNGIKLDISFSCNNFYVNSTMVFINNTITGNINNLYISNNGIFNCGATSTININNNVYCYGFITSGNAFTLNLLGENANRDNILNLITGVNVSYNRNGNQNIINGVYPGTVVLGAGIKTLTGDVIINNTLTIGGSTTLECSAYNLTVNSTTIDNGGNFSKSDGGNIIFIGQYQKYGGNLSLLGNPTVEFRNGFFAQNVGSTWFSGNGTWNFTTNNQSFTVNFTNKTYDCNIVIASGITLTINTTAGSAGAGGVTLTSTINGTDNTSKLILGGGAIGGTVLNFATAASVPSMTTGIWDFTTNANTIQYNGNYSATIPSYFTTFHNLTIGGAGTIKTLGVNTTLNGNLSVASGTLQLSTYNLTVTGTSIVTPTSGFLAKNGAGSILFIGNFQPGNAIGQVDFRTGNPTVELRGGLTITNSNPNPNTIYTGSGQWSFTTNNQSMNSWNTSFPINFDAPIVIANGITLTVASTMYAQFSNTINGAGATSKLTNQGFIGFATAASVPSLTTGTWDFTTSANTVLYNGNYSATIPSYFTIFHNLTIGGTGTKTTAANITTNAAVTITGSGSLTLGGNLTVGGNLAIGSLSLVGTLECSTYNLTVNGTTTIGVGGSKFSKNGAGNILFVGNVTGSDAGAGGSRFDLSGNPNVELRGGFTALFYGALGLFTSGTGTWTFTTNNQTVNCLYRIYSFNCTIIISNVTVTMTSTAGAGGVFGLNGTIDGTTAGSTLNLNGSLYLNNATTPLPMFTTGVFNPTFGASALLGFVFNGNYTIPYSTLNGLVIGGTGTKSLGSNTTVTSLQFNYSTNASLQLGIYNFTNSGQTIWTSGGAGSSLLKSGAGTVLFVGLISFTQGSAIINFSSGNPTIEMRGGIQNGGNAGSTINLGTGNLTFTTNNQSINLAYLAVTFNNNILISGAITLTFTGSNNTHVFTGTINGDNANSKLVNSLVTAAGLNYQNATQPMATGILDTSTNLNTWIYGSGNQDIKGGASLVAKQVYRNLTLNGGGVKTLQGYVSVQNTYTLTAPATLALNGFTLTNP